MGGQAGRHLFVGLGDLENYWSFSQIDCSSQAVKKMTDEKMTGQPSPELGFTAQEPTLPNDKQQDAPSLNSSGCKAQTHLRYLPQVWPEDASPSSQHRKHQVRLVQLHWRRLYAVAQRRLDPFQLRITQNYKNIKPKNQKIFW